MQWGVVLTVALGGALGSVLRYLVAGAVQPAWWPGFPFGIFVVNVSGGLVMGLITALAALKLEQNKAESGVKDAEGKLPKLQEAFKKAADERTKAEAELAAAAKVATEAKGKETEQAEADKVAPIVANAGLYNAFLAAGLMWSLFTGDMPSLFFFLSCVAVAGVYGAVTLKKTTLILQTLPALIGLLVVWSARASIG